MKSQLDHQDRSHTEFEQLVEVVGKLRAPGGCPWDREQTFFSMKQQFLSEVYEFIDALESEDCAGMAEELGDLFFHLIFFSIIGEEQGNFTLPEILTQIKEKLVRRHPHVFENQDSLSTAQVKANWEKIKSEVEGKKYASRLDSIPRSLPPLLRAQTLAERGSRVGFDWSSAVEVLPKIREELIEVEEVFAARNRDGLENELGDLLFVVLSLVRLAGFQSDQVLSGANRKFERRFRHMEKSAALDGKDLETLSLTEQELLWQRAKKDVG